MISAGPSGQSVLTTGTPQRIASTRVIPNDSASEADATIDALANSASIGETGPVSSARPVSPSPSISPWSASRSAPPPWIRSRHSGCLAATAENASISRSKRLPRTSRPAAAISGASPSEGVRSGAGTMLGTASTRTPGSGIRLR